MREARPLQSSELMLLLNQAAKQRKRLRFTSPILGIEILEFDAGSGQITQAVTKAQFNAACKKATREGISDELPAWSDIEQAMRASGLIPFANQGEIVGVVRAFEEEGLDPSRPKLKFLGVDTNILYHRLATRHLERLLGGPARAIRVVLSKGTRDELDARAKHKIGHEEMESMVAAWGHEATVRQFRNRKGRINRKAHNGLGEYEALVRRRRAAEAPCEETTRDKEENDRLIAKSYAQFESLHRADVQLVTGDAGMTTHADAQDLRSLLISYGRQESIPTGRVDEAALLHFIHDLAVELMVLDVDATSIQLWSDWNSKRMSQWQTETLQMTYDPNDNMAAGVVADLRACDLVKEAERSTSRQVRLYQKAEAPSTEKTASEEVPSTTEADGMGLDGVMEIAAMRRLFTIEELSEKTGITLPKDMIQPDETVKDALLAAYLRREGKPEAADILSHRVRQTVLAMSGREELLEACQ